MMAFFKQGFVIIFMIIFLGLIGWLIWQRSKPEVFPEGSIIPELEYKNEKGIHILKVDTTQKTMVVLFHQKCDHCRYQLEQFNDHFNELMGIGIYIFTTEQQFFKNNNMNQWPRLSGSESVHWGIVNREAFKNNFGSTATPYILFFNESGELYYKIQGERRIERILELLRYTEQT